MELANDHWKYIKNILEKHKVQKEIIDIVAFHYVSAFIHGYKHGVEEDI